jgi:hypothetical protein
LESWRQSHFLEIFLDFYARSKTLAKNSLQIDQGSNSFSSDRVEIIP